MISHGIATVKESFGNFKQSEQGIITAYLPELEKFAIMFNNHGWITFNWSEEEFLKHFNVELNTQEDL